MYVNTELKSSHVCDLEIPDFTVLSAKDGNTSG